MPVRAWFPTFVYCEPLQRTGLPRLNRELTEECSQLRAYDKAGRRWSEKNYPGGYTSYASLNRLHQFSSSFADLGRKLTRHVRAFAGFNARQRILRGVEDEFNLVAAGPFKTGQQQIQHRARAVGGA